MKNIVANYKIFITKDQQTGSQKAGYVAYVPKLGIADDGKTVEEALKNVESLIRFHLDCLIEEGESIPVPDTEDAFVTSTEIKLSPQKSRKFEALIS